MLYTIYNISGFYYFKCLTQFIRIENQIECKRDDPIQFEEASLKETKKIASHYVIYSDSESHKFSCA